MKQLNKISLQINIAPTDYPHIHHILPHQLSILANQADEIILTLDSRRSKGRFGKDWDRYEESMNRFLQSAIITQYNVKLFRIDYGTAVKKEISSCFIKSGIIPDKDFRGGPFYAYFFGLFKAENDYVFHLDSDILLGGKSSTWVAEAKAILDSDPSAFIVSPLPGPPHPQDKLIGQVNAAKTGAYQYQFSTMSTRLFLMNKRLLINNKLKLKKPSVRNQAKAIIERNPNADLPEHLLSAFMQENSFKRIDFLGNGDGLWSLHPPYRTQSFYDNLPGIIERMANNNMPQSQWGFYDVVDELCDWTEAREKLKQNRWWKRLGK